MMCVRIMDVFNFLGDDMWDMNLFCDIIVIYKLVGFYGLVSIC